MFFFGFSVLGNIVRANPGLHARTLYLFDSIYKRRERKIKEFHESNVDPSTADNEKR